MYELKSKMCKSCIHTKVCMKDKNLCGDTFVMGNPCFFDNEELYQNYKEWDAAGFPCDDYISENAIQDAYDRGIKDGAELAAMHGSDATSQELQKQYFKGMEEGYQKGREGFVKKGQWLSSQGWIYCSICGSEPPIESNYASDYCPNCGAEMIGI